MINVFLLRRDEISDKIPLSFCFSLSVQWDPLLCAVVSPCRVCHVQTCVFFYTSFISGDNVHPAGLRSSCRWAIVNAVNQNLIKIKKLKNNIIGTLVQLDCATFAIIDSDQQTNRYDKKPIVFDRYVLIELVEYSTRKKHVNSTRL